MTNPYAPPPPRKLERSATDRVVSGVCGGVAQYLNLDPTLVRILTVVLTVFTGAPIIVYLIALLVMPEAPRAGGPPQRPYAVRPPSSAPGPWPRARSTEDQVIWGNEGAPWEQPQPATPPPPPRHGEAEPGRPGQV